MRYPKYSKAAQSTSARRPPETREDFPDSQIQALTPRPEQTREKSDRAATLFEQWFDIDPASLDEELDPYAEPTRKRG